MGIAPGRSLPLKQDCFWLHDSIPSFFHKILPPILSIQFLKFLLIQFPISSINSFLLSLQRLSNSFPVFPTRTYLGFLHKFFPNSKNSYRCFHKFILCFFCIAFPFAFASIRLFQFLPSFPFL